MSFAVVLTAFFVAFEYSSDDSGTIDTDMSMLDELHRKDDDMIPLVLPVRLKMPEARNEKSVSDRMKILDDDAEIVMPEEKGSDTDGDADKILDIAKFEPPQPDDAEDMPPILNPDIDDNPLNFRIVEQLPEYPGGPVEFMRWLTLNLKYPDSARRRKVQGRVMSQFVVGTDGSISDLRIVAPHNATGYYFFYERDRLTTLGVDTLHIVTERAEQYVIYADVCTLSKEDMAAKNIIFKKIPRDIKRF